MMHKLILVTIIIACSFSAFAQSEQSQPLKDTFVVDKAGEKRVFTSVEQMPEFPGGQSGLLKYLSKNIRYPKKAREEDIQGKVIIKFIVCENGTLRNEEIVRSVGGGCDEEVLRVVKAMPKWKPGKQNGETVKVYYTLPVSFKLEKGDKPKKIEK